MYNLDVAIHLDVIDAARRVADDSGVQAAGVVDALPHLNPGTVRTHVGKPLLRECAETP